MQHSDHQDSAHVFHVWVCSCAPGEATQKGITLWCQIQGLILRQHLNIAWIHALNTHWISVPENSLENLYREQCTSHYRSQKLWIFSLTDLRSTGCAKSPRYCCSCQWLRRLRFMGISKWETIEILSLTLFLARRTPFWDVLVTCRTIHDLGQEVGANNPHTATVFFCQVSRGAVRKMMAEAVIHPEAM